MNKEERLREYINKDYSYINYKTGVEEGTDFDKFCIQHCKDIEELLEENQKYKEVIDKAMDLIEKSVTTDIGIDSNNNIIHYHQLTEDETGELLDILKEVE